MNKNSNSYVLIFSVAVCVVMSTALALTANSLKPLQEAAAEFDRQKNVMLVAGLIQPGDPRPMAELRALYADRVVPRVVDLQTGEVDESRTVASVAALKSPAERARYRVVEVARDERGEPSGFILPITAKGLWGPMFGYLALESDANTVRGITFHQHKETPGLGGEVDNPPWKESWKGKTVLTEGGDLVGVKVKKGAVDPSNAQEKKHAVDGLSGATITSNGVTAGIKSDLEAFTPFLSKTWGKKN